MTTPLLVLQALPKRRLIWICHPEAQVRTALRQHLLSQLPNEEVLLASAATKALRAALGQSKSAVVLDLSQGLKADMLAASQGFVRAGGALVIETDVHPAPSTLAIWPFGPEAMGQHFEARIWQWLKTYAERAEGLQPLALAPPLKEGSAEQAACVDTLTRWLAKDQPGHVVLTADRGRGKSAALGLWLAKAAETVQGPIYVSAENPEALESLLAFYPQAQVVALRALRTQAYPAPALCVIDEAATAPVFALRALVQAWPQTRFVFASTIHGYEGSGKGFVLRFLPWLHQQAPTLALSLKTPIRYRADCALEHSLAQVLLLDTELYPLSPEDSLSHMETWTGHALSQHEATLREVFALLVHAHYRTTPSDLQQILNAPNLAIHLAKSHQGRVLAASLVAQEGALDRAKAEAIYRGRERLAAHALADALVAHLGELSIGTWPMVRSVRIATHPMARQRGLASQLVAYVHACYPEAELLGTLFGASAEVVRFREQLGYRLVRVSASRSARTGEPSVVMLYPKSARAEALVATLQGRYAANWPYQAKLLAQDGVGLSEDLVAALTPTVVAQPWPLDKALQVYAEGPRTLETLIEPLHRLLLEHPEGLASLSNSDQALLRTRILEGASWEEAAQVAGLAHAGVAMKRARPALLQVAEHAGLWTSKPKPTRT